MSDESMPIVSVEDNSIEAQLQRASQLLPIHEYNMLRSYIEAGKHALSSDTCLKFFELFLSGTDCSEIHRLNKAFPYEAILWARIKYNWDTARDLNLFRLQQATQNKVMKAQLEATSLMSDMIAAANRRYGDKLKRYLQTGDEDEIKGVMGVESIQGLLRVMEGLLKATGQDRISKTIHESRHHHTVVNSPLQASLASPAQTGDKKQTISSEAAAQVLAIIANEKRKNNGTRQN